MFCFLYLSPNLPQPNHQPSLDFHSRWSSIGWWQMTCDTWKRWQIFLLIFLKTFCIVSTIRTPREIQCLQYAGFLSSYSIIQKEYHPVLANFQFWRICWMNALSCCCPWRWILRSQGRKSFYYTYQQRNLGIPGDQHYMVSQDKCFLVNQLTPSLTHWLVPKQQVIFKRRENTCVGLDTPAYNCLDSSVFACLLLSQATSLTEIFNVKNAMFLRTLLWLWHCYWHIQCESGHKWDSDT